MKKNKFLGILSYSISGLFSPFLIIGLMVVFVSCKYLGNIAQVWPKVLLSLILLVGIPGISILVLFKKKVVSGWHLHQRKDRNIPLIIALVSSLAALMVLYSLNTPNNLLAVVTLVFINILLVWIITLFWKISVHAATFTTAVTVLIFILGPFWIWLYLLIIPIGWARVYRESHSWYQVLAGAVLAMVISILIFNAYGYSFWISYLK